MKNHLSAISFILAITSFLAILSSCGNNANNGEPDSVSESDEATSSAAPDYLDTLGTKDFGGASYTIVYPNVTTSGMLNMHSGEITGEVVNDAQFNRDKFVEKQYNVSIEYIILDDIGGSDGVANSSLAGDHVSDIYIHSLSDGKRNLGSVFTKGALANMLDFPYLQLDREWWSSLMYENFKINDKIYFTSGDLAPSSFLGLACVYMNLKVAGNYGIDSSAIFDKVYDGSWTHDYMYTLTKDLDIDLNNDDKLDCINDFFGVVNEYNNLTSTMLLASCGVHLSEINKKTGKLEADLGSPKVSAVVEKMASIYKLIDNAGDNTNFFDKNFKYDGSLFAIHYIESTLRRFRDMESDYVMYPMPKYDEKQESYVSYLNPWVSGFISIPLVQNDHEKTGFITEVLEYLSVRDVRPEVIDVTLKGKALRDDDSIAILDLIFSTSYLDYNGIYEFGGGLGAVNSAIFGGKPYQSTLESKKSKMETEIEEFSKLFD